MQHIAQALEEISLWEMDIDHPPRGKSQKVQASLIKIQAHLLEIVNPIPTTKDSNNA